MAGKDIAAMFLRTHEHSGLFQTGDISWREQIEGVDQRGDLAVRQHT